MIVNRLSSLVLQIQVTGDTGDVVTPVVLSWTLVNPAGETVNGRNNVTISPNTTMYIALNGDDLPYYEEPLVLTLTGTYLSVHGTLNINKTILIHTK